MIAITCIMLMIFKNNRHGMFGVYKQFCKKFMYVHRLSYVSVTDVRPNRQDIDSCSIQTWETLYFGWFYTKSDFYHSTMKLETQLNIKYKLQ